MQRIQFMNKTAYFFAICALLLSSCKAHYHLNLIKEKDHPQIVVHDLHEESREFQPSVATQTSIVPARFVSNETKMQDFIEENKIENDPDTIRVGADSDEIDETEAMVAEAYRAEKFSKAAMGTSIAAVATFLGGILGIFGFPLFIAALVLYYIGNRSRYNTEKGVKRLKVARVFLTIFGIVLAVTLVILLLLFLFI